MYAIRSYYGLYSLTMMNVGLETESEEPHPLATPCTKVVFPVPKSPCKQITSPACSAPPRYAPMRRVCSGLRLKKSIECESRMGIEGIIPKCGRITSYNVCYTKWLRPAVLFCWEPAKYQWMFQYWNLQVSPMNRPRITMLYQVSWQHIVPLV